MERSLKGVFIGLVVLATSALGTVGQNWTQITTGNWTIPYGNSTSKTFAVTPKGSTGQLRVGYEGAYCNTVQVRYIEVTYDLGITDRVTANSDGVFEIDAEETLRAVKIYNYQGVYKKVTCRESIYLAEGEFVEEEDFDYLGTVRYQGGKNTSQLSAKTAKRITHFWVEVPSYCNDLRIRRAGTITESVFDEAEQVEENRYVYAVNGGAGSRISAIELDLKGPSSLSCDLAIYVRTK